MSQLFKTVNSQFFICLFIFLNLFLKSPDNVNWVVLSIKIFSLKNRLKYLFHLAKKFNFFIITRWHVQGQYYGPNDHSELDNDGTIQH